MCAHAYIYIYIRVYHVYSVPTQHTVQAGPSDTLHNSLHIKLHRHPYTLSMCQEDQLAKPQQPLNTFTQAHIRSCHDSHHAVCAALCRLLRLLIAPAPVPTVDIDQLLR